jgi:hypothetical protein
VRNVLDDLSIQKGKPQAKRRGSRWSYAETPGLRGFKRVVAYEGRCDLRGGCCRYRVAATRWNRERAIIRASEGVRIMKEGRDEGIVSGESTATTDLQTANCKAAKVSPAAPVRSTLHLDIRWNESKFRSGTAYGRTD